MKRFKPNFQFLLLAVSSLLAFIVLTNIKSIKDLIENSKFEASLKNRERMLLESQQAPDEITLVIIGDVMLGRTVTLKSEKEMDWGYPFRKTSAFLNKSDLVFANLENPIIHNCPRHETGFKFCAPPEMTIGLSEAGIDIVTLANNHTRNFGQEGLEETKKFLEKEGILATGLGSLVTREVKGTRFGFLGFDFLTRAPTETEYELIRSSSRLVDVLVIGVHWGVEYTSEPTKSQRERGKKLIEEGADVIAGHHPHWVQESEIVNGVPIFYSLGNFVFDQMWSEQTKKGVMVELTFQDGQLKKQTIYNTYMSAWAQPEILEKK